MEKGLISDEATNLSYAVRSRMDAQPRTLEFFRCVLRDGIKSPFEGIAPEILEARAKAGDLPDFRVDPWEFWGDLEPLASGDFLWQNMSPAQAHACAELILQAVCRPIRIFSGEVYVLSAPTSGFLEEDPALRGIIEAAEVVACYRER